MIDLYRGLGLGVPALMDIAALIARVVVGLDADTTKAAMLAAGGSTAAVGTALAAIGRTTPTRGGTTLARTSGRLDTNGTGADRL